jgi:S-(hydroxymethyl)glutathione dehydrogenase/alcohol dehydrogenase
LNNTFLRHGADSVPSVRAAVMRAVGRPLTIEDVDIDPPQEQEVLIDVAAAGLCHSDLRFLEGSFDHPLPTVLGHEVAGTVAAVGDAVTEVAVGDHVVMSISVSCGTCPLCRSGRSHLCVDKGATRRRAGQPSRLSQAGSPITQFLDLSAFAEQILVHESAVVGIGEDVPFEHAAVLGCGVATGLGAALNTARVQPGDSVVVIGCGGVGLSAVQGARIAGAHQIIAIDPVPEKLDLAMRLGATEVVDAADPGLVPAVVSLSDGLGVDHVIEAVGRVPSIEQGFAMTRRGGTVTVVGLVPGGSTVNIPTDDLFYERRLQGSVMGSNDFKRDVPRYLEMWRDGTLNLGDLVTRRITLEEVNEGFAAMSAGRHPRILIDFS